jgi:glucan phosphoethanolaminetransferase (alkaline phosphatase superfamily)
MAVGSSYNERTHILLGKIVLSAAIVTAYMSQLWLVETTFRAVSHLFAIHWSAKEWSFRVNLDLWTVYAGMLAAMFTLKVQERRLTDHPRWPTVCRGSIIFSTLVIVCYFVFELRQESKFTYNVW